MNWKKKLKKIAEENPDALHPSLKALRKTTPAGKAWDRAEWYKDHNECAHGHRPIMFVLSWLAKKGLLTDYGNKEHKKFHSAIEKTMITEGMVEFKARKFLDKYYEIWYQTSGIDLAIDPLIEGNEKLLSEYWANYGKNKS